ncbi:MAG: mitomycin antibiotic biosynthesis protein [Phycisphaeraceae bacterium]|nr:mitomycin antibiotic biosynthesis protein [Phycisphaeraceae bacterium]
MSSAESSNVSVQALEVTAEGLDIQAAADIYRHHGCLVVRGLMTRYLTAIRRDIDRIIEETVAGIDGATRVEVGWSTPNGALLIPAPEGYHRDKQMMCLPLSYHHSAAFFQSAFDPTALDLVEAVLGPNIELFQLGQSLVKEPVGGHPKNLHQDAAYFEHKYEGPMGQLTYVVDTDLENGCLHVVPGSHRLGVLKHEDTLSHLGLNADEWPWERALPIVGRAGDAIFFHVKCIHGSKPNRSDQPRPVFIHRYRRSDDFIVINATTTANREEAEKHVAEAKKDNQLHLMVRGFREFDLERE